MNPFEGKKTYQVFLVIGLIAVVVVAVLTIIKMKQKTTPEKKEITVKTKDYNPEELPDKFPKEIPLEKDATVIINNDTTSSIGHFSAIRRFESKKTLQDNFDLYKDFFNKNGWTIANTVDTENLKIINASKDKMSVRIDINKNTVTNIITVDITATPEGGAK